MKLPYSDRATIARRKLTAYLLSTTHPGGRSKARFFRSRGFDEKNCDLLTEALLRIARSEEVRETVTSAYGSKYVIDGHMQTPSGGQVRLRTVWIIEHGGKIPHFVTAYPL
jgi:hypothetical protein